VKKKYLVTGASGFIGSHVADILSDNGYDVCLFDKKISKFKQHKQKMFIGNINNLNHIIKVSKNVEAIFHFAATADLKAANEDPFQTIENNIIGTVKILKACLKNKVKKIIFASSIYARSEQGGFYSTSKLVSEMLIERFCKKYKIKFVILRFGTIYGERANDFNTVQKFINDATSSKKIVRNSIGHESRNYIHVLDVAKLTLELLKKKYENKYYNIFGKKNFFVKDLLKIIKKNIPSLKLKFSKVDNREFNYKVNPFSYKIREGKNFVKGKYISLDQGVKNLIEKSLSMEDQNN